MRKSPTSPVIARDRRDRKKSKARVQAKERRVRPAELSWYSGAVASLLRDALVEAVSSVESVLDANLPPHRDQWTEREKSLHSKWSARVGDYNALLKHLGGKRRAHLCWEDFAR